MYKPSSSYSIEFIPLDSFVHKLDPRSKILVSAVFMASVFLADKIWEIALLSLLAAGLIFLSQIDIGYYWRGIRPFLWLIIISASIQALLTPGEPLWQLSFISITEDGLRAGVWLISKILLILVLAQFLLLTTSTLALTDGLEKMLQPLSKIGLPTAELLMIITIAIRFLPLLMREAIDVKNAQMARGADFVSGSLLSRLNKQVAIIVPVFNLALQRATDLAQAMESRAYAPGEPRTRLNELKMRLEDYGSIGLAIATALIIAIY